MSSTQVDIRVPLLATTYEQSQGLARSKAFKMKTTIDSLGLCLCVCMCGHASEKGFLASNLTHYRIFPKHMVKISSDYKWCIT